MEAHQGNRGRSRHSRGAHNPNRKPFTQYTGYHPATVADTTDDDELTNQMSGLAVSSNDFFADFPDFKYNKEKSLKGNFQRLAKSQGWEWKSEERREQMSRMMESEFRRFYGQGTSLGGWQTLCKDLGIKPAPDSIDECQEDLIKLFVNIWDFVDWKRLDEDDREDFDQHFASLEKLRIYTKQKGKFYPSEKAKEGGYLWVLLRLILTKNPNLTYTFGRFK